MKLSTKLLKITALLLVSSLCLFSIAFGWYVNNQEVTANGLKVSTEEITEDGIISTDGNSERNYKIHETITANLKATKNFTSVKIKFEFSKLSESNYKTLCESNQKYIRSDYLKNNVIYKPTTLDDEKNIMWNMYKENNVIDYYKATLTLGSGEDKQEYSLEDREDTSTNIRVFKRDADDGEKLNVSGSTDDLFTIVVSFGTQTNGAYNYPSYIISNTDESGNTTSTTTVCAMNYNCFLIGLSLKITFIAE